MNNNDIEVKAIDKDNYMLSLVGIHFSVTVSYGKPLLMAFINKDQADRLAFHINSCIQDMERGEK